MVISVYLSLRGVCCAFNESELCVILIVVCYPEGELCVLLKASCVFSLSREWTVCEVEHNETPEETS